VSIVSALLLGLSVARCGREVEIVGDGGGFGRVIFMQEHGV